jgi:two-component system, chemotaxis family, sensor kinase CheA
MSIQLAQYRELYFSEAREQLERIADALSKLERAPGDRTAIKAAFRAAHTLKGMSATMGYDEMTVLAHALEDLLQSVREQAGDASAAHISPLFRTLEHMDRIISRLEAGQPPEAEGDGEGTQVAIPALTPADLAGRAPGEIWTVVRVSYGQLDQVMALIVQLAANAHRLAHRQADAEDEAGRAKWREHLSLLKQLLAAAWSLQMAPIGEVFDRFPRMLHDLARVQGKEIRVKLEGGEIEVGRGVLEEINETLLHLVRNAVAHGIEPLTERLRAGKDLRGTILLRASRCDDSITIEVGDDGRGLDAQRILQAAYKQGYISEAARGTLSEAEAYDLIMLPGFSLSPVVTNVSGRGVGMDIVKAKVEALQGSMRIRSRPGLGATFILQIRRSFGPLQVELVRLGDQIFAVPGEQTEKRLTLVGDDLDWLRTSGLSVSNPSIRVIDLRLSRRQPPRGNSEPYGCLVINHGGGIALCVDELLGKALWSKPSSVDAPTIPLLDLNQLNPA